MRKLILDNAYKVVAVIAFMMLCTCVLANGHKLGYASPDKTFTKKVKKAKKAYMKSKPRLRK